MHPSRMVLKKGRRNQKKITRQSNENKRYRYLIPELDRLQFSNLQTASDFLPHVLGPTIFFFNIGGFLAVVAKRGSGRVHWLRNSNQVIRFLNDYSYKIAYTKGIFHILGPDSKTLQLIQKQGSLITVMNRTRRMSTI